MNFQARTLLLVVALGTVFAVIGCDSGQRALKNTPTQILVKKGDHAMRYGRTEEAADYYSRVLNRAPGNVYALTQYGKCMLKMGEPSKAALAFETAVSSKPEDGNLVYLLARSEYENGQYDRAFDLLRQFAIDNNDVTAWTLLAEYSLQLDDPDTASHAIERAIELNGDSSAGPYLTAANLAERLGNDQEALRRLRQAYGCEPSNSEVDRRLREYGEIPGPSLTLGADE